MMHFYEARSYERWAPVVGRVLIALLLIISGFGKLTGFAGTVAYAETFNVPFPLIAVVIAIVVELGGGLLLLAGYRTRLVATISAAFIVVATLFFHTNFADPTQQIQFLKNIAIIGGLLYVSVYGAQKVALKKCAPPKE